MDWQFIAMWLVVGGAVIWILGGLMTKRFLRGNSPKRENKKCR